MQNTTHYMSDFVDSLTSSVGANVKAIPIAIILAIVCYFIFRAVNRVFKKYSQKLPFEDSVIKVVNTIINILIIFFSVMIIASALGINTSSLIAAFSIFGLAISLAVQSIMSNLANAMSIYLNKPFKIGDYVLVDGIEGTVIDVNFMLTKINTYKNEIVYIPNNQIGASIITNFSEQAKRRIEHSIILPYDNEVDKVKYALRSAVDSIPLVLKDDPINIFISSYELTGIKYTIRCYCKNEDFIDCGNILMERYKEAFDKEHIQVPQIIYNSVIK